MSFDISSCTRTIFVIFSPTMFPSKTKQSSNVSFKIGEHWVSWARAVIYGWRRQKNSLPRAVLRSSWRYSWETIPRSYDCLMWNSHFLSQTWNSLACVWKLKRSHLQGSEPCPRDQLDEMYKLKLKTFVYCSPSRKCSLTTDLNTEECINTHALPSEKF